MVLSILEKESLYAKESKCEFGMNGLLHLGHMISVDGVQVDPEKTRAIVDWPTPTNLRQLKIYLVLYGFYRRFVKKIS